MVGDLGSQVEHAAAVSEGDHPLESSVSVTIATTPASKETDWPDYGTARSRQTAYGNSRTTFDEMQTRSSKANDSSEPP